jgi:hypothetical protein
LTDGTNDGSIDGTSVVKLEGLDVGTADGCGEGSRMVMEGWDDGTDDGSTDGTAVVKHEGLDVGIADGCEEGSRMVMEG